MKETWKEAFTKMNTVKQAILIFVLGLACYIAGLCMGYYLC